MVCLLLYTMSIRNVFNGQRFIDRVVILEVGSIE